MKHFHDVYSTAFGALLTCSDWFKQESVKQLLNRSRGVNFPKPVRMPFCDHLIKQEDVPLELRNVAYNHRAYRNSVDTVWSFYYTSKLKSLPSISDLKESRSTIPMIGDSLFSVSTQYVDYVDTLDVSTRDILECSAWLQELFHIMMYFSDEERESVDRKMSRVPRTLGANKCYAFLKGNVDEDRAGIHVLPYILWKSLCGPILRHPFQKDSEMCVTLVHPAYRLVRLATSADKAMDAMGMHSGIDENDFLEWATGDKLLEFDRVISDIAQLESFEDYSGFMLANDGGFLAVESEDSGSIFTNASLRTAKCRQLLSDTIGRKGAFLRRITTGELAVPGEQQDLELQSRLLPLIIAGPKYLGGCQLFLDRQGQDQFIAEMISTYMFMDLDREVALRQAEMWLQSSYLRGPEVSDDEVYEYYQKPIHDIFGIDRSDCIWK
jgi:hypothetical protein